METREAAFKVLNLPETADLHQIEQAYRRLVRRYPPEFHSEKFRKIDEAYRLLTSLSFHLEKLLNPQKKEDPLAADLFIFDPTPPENPLGKALAEAKRLFRKNHLWSSLKDPFS